MIETTALGAAGLAGIAGGVWNDAAEFIGTRQFTRFTPAMSSEAADELKAGWERAVRATLSWARDQSGSKATRKKAKKKKSASPGPAKPAKKKAASRRPSR